MFYGMSFKYNDIDSNFMYGAYICNQNGDRDGRNVGFNSNIQLEESGINGLYHALDTKHNNITFPFNISFNKKLNNKERQNVLHWLFPLDNEYKELEVEDNAITYFVKFKSAKWKEYATVDLLILEAETDSAYGYTPLITYDVKLLNSSESKTISIDNYCDVFQFYMPVLEITFNDSGILTIKNNTTNEIMTVSGVNGENVNINCFREVATSSIKLFKYSDINNYLRFRYGKNELVLSGVSAKVSIKCRFYVMFQ